jgi:predicted RNase H-like nuclease (RuvC/YqgF family)
MTARVALEAEKNKWMTKSQRHERDREALQSENARLKEQLEKSISPLRLELEEAITKSRITTLEKELAQEKTKIADLEKELLQEKTKNAANKETLQKLEQAKNKCAQVTALMGELGNDIVAIKKET